MQNFIVLGIVPGTNIQTTFMFWLGVVAVFCALLSIPTVLHFASIVRTHLVARKIARIIDRFDLITI